METTRKPRVLLVEDNPDDEILTVLALGDCGMEVELHIARDGAEALEMLAGSKKLDPQPNLVLLDLKVPKIGGLELLNKIREQDPERRIAVVALTSSDEIKDIQEAYRLGANSYIRKPIDFEQFKDAVRHMASYWLAQNVPAL